jgi:PKD repeat protein
VAVGNTVYVVGSFTRARPAGVALGSPGEVTRNNILAYDITTGALTSFNPGLNAQAHEVTASPDGSRIYVVGEFTQAAGVTRNRVAAFNTADGSLVTGFNPNVSGPVYAVAATASTVYLGGSFAAVGATPRTRLAAVQASNGAVIGAWDPVPGVGPGGSDIVLGLAVTSSTQVVVGGRFGTMNGDTARGIAAVDATTGATRPFAVNQLLLNNGVSSAVTSVSTDGVNVYASAYNFGGGGNLEGTFIAEADGVELVLVNDCRGDSYAAYPMNGVMYVASHTHNCEWIGGSIELSPRVEKRATAFTITPTTRVRPHAFTNWPGKPAGTQLAWNPGLEPGSYTGQTQAAWSITGNGSYVSYGGEFPRVNGQNQQGLVRFAMPGVAGNPNAEGPAFTTNQGPIVSTFAASVDVSAPGVARVSWPETWDIDNEYLTYRVYRDSKANPPIHTVTRPSRWFNLEWMGFSDIGQSGQHQYKVTATDPFGNWTETAWASVNIPSGSPSARPYVDLVKADGATDHWSLGETSGIGYNDLGGNDLIIGGGVSRNQSGAISDGNPAYGFNGSSAGFVATERSVQAPNTVSVEAWFRTNTGSGGKIVGFGDSNTGSSTDHDRSIYMDGAGRVIFGVGDNHTQHRGTIRTTGSYNKGAWHHVVGTLGPNGMALYVDGQSVGILTTGSEFAGVGPNYYGYWRIGGDTSWSGGSGYFNGWIDEVAIYEHVLSPTQIANHRLVGLGQPPINVAPTASFSQAVTDLTVSVDASSSTDSDGTIVGYAWDFGDGATATGVTAAHTYAVAGTYPVRLTVTDDRNATGSITEMVTVTSGQIPPPAGPDYVPVVPERLLETRVSEGQVGYVGAQPVAGQTIELQVTGVGTTNVPATASAVVLNVAVTGALSDGYATVWPCGLDRPTASNVNYRAGSSVANVVVSGVGAGGKVCVYTLAATDIIADINGWFPAATSYEPVVPERLLETRVSEGQVGYVGAQPVAGQTIELQVTGVGTAAVPATASAVVLNVAVTGALSDGYATVWPCGQARPTASNLNFVAGSSVANVVISGIGTGGRVCVYTLAATDIIADINGWFPAAP